MNLKLNTLSLLCTHTAETNPQSLMLTKTVTA